MSREAIQRYALLIGVNDYTLWRSACADAPGDLQAPRNDVRAWFKALRRLGVPAAHITVLTSPALTPEELECDEARCFEATTAEVERASAAMTQRLRRDGERGVGFVSFVGHGDNARAAGSFTVLADYDGGATTWPSEEVAREGVLSVVKLQERMCHGAEESACVFVWDACRQVGSGSGPGIVDTRPINCTSLVATGLGGESFERCFDGVWRGQYAWALQTVLQQWPRAEYGGVPYIAIDYHTLQERAATLIAVFTNATQSQRPEGAPGGAFLLPRGSRAWTSPVAASAPGYEFPAGTSSFTSASGTVFGTCDVGTVVTWLFEQGTPFGSAPADWTIAQAAGGGGFTPDLSRVTRWRSGPGAAVQGAPPATVMFVSKTATPTVCVTVVGFTVTWYLAAATKPSALPQPFDLVAGSAPPALPAGQVWWRWVDPLDRRNLGQISGCDPTGAIVWARDVADNFHTSSNGGANWTPPQQAPNNDIDVSGVDSMTCWAVKTDQTVRRTTDGGASWQVIPGTLVQVSARSANVAWGVNASQEVWRTTNGGSNWVQSTAASLAQISALDGTVAWGVSPSAQVWRTTDGGATWSQPDSGAALVQISAVDTNTAWGVNSGHRVYLRTAGGWTGPLPAANPIELRSVLGLTATSALGVNRNGETLRTDDGGQTWRLP